MATPVVDFTADNLAAITAALSHGVLSVTFADRTVTYASLKDLMLLRAEMVRMLNAGNRSYRLAATRKGV
jgi:hypothetical protein